MDRLHYLERRLHELGGSDDETKVLFPCPMEYLSNPTTPQGGGTVDFFMSFRSPYTYLALARCKRLAEMWGARFNVRYVLPMVMRGLPVPRVKGLYFSQDAAREARRIGIPFGRIADSVGKPVERGYSLIQFARDNQREFEYCQSFMQAAWAEGVDAGSDDGMRFIVERADLEWTQARPLIGNLDWQVEAEANRELMFTLGHWGVPCIRVGDVAVWGQDRLWVIEDELRRLRKPIA